MVFRRIGALAFAALLSLAAQSALAAPSQAEIDALVQASHLEVETFSLRNGMEVVVIPDLRMPVVTHMVWYRIGSADEVQGKSGLAHFLEHLMFKGTKKIPPGEYSKIVARNGGQDNAFTSWDYTAYYQRVARDRLELVMGMEADRMRNLQLTDEIVYPERDVIVEERRQRIDNQPASLLSEQMDAALYENSRYGVPIIGWIHEMQGLTREDALAWYRRYYAPNNAILVVAGDIDAESLRPLAEKTYGRIHRADTPERTRPVEPAQSAARRVTVTDARAEQPSLRRVYHAVGKEDLETSAALDVAAYVLGGSPTSRLNRTLVVDDELAAGASAGYWSVRVNGGEFSVSATPRDGVTLEALERAMDGVIDKLVADGPTADEVADAKFNLIAAAAYARDSQFGLARGIGSDLTAGASLEEILGWPERIARVTPEASHAALGEAIDIDKSVTGLLVPGEDTQ